MLLLGGGDALALAGDLKQPSISMASGYPAEARRQIMTALNHPDSKFLNGRYVNWFTTMHYRGDTRALNGFMAGLIKCPSVTLRVTFNKELIFDGDWTVRHNGQNGAFNILINLKSTNLDLAGLEIPTAKGPPLEQSPLALEG